MLPSIRHWKICAVLALSTLFTLQAAGWFLTWGILQLEAKNAAQIAINRQETPLENITLPVALLAKIRVGKKEFRLEGRLYDIVHQKIIGDSVVLEAYHDRKEEAVLRGLGSLFRPGGSDPNAPALPLQNWLAQWLGSAFLVPQMPGIVLPQVVVFPHHFICLLPVAQFAPGCFLPPPESIFSEQRASA